MSIEAPDQRIGRDRTHRIAVPLVLLGISIFFAARHFYPEKPPTNSDDYLAAHGIVAGQTNELRINGVLMRFPPAYLPNPYTGGRIVAGEADHVNVEIDLASWFYPEQLARATYLALVSVRIEKYRVEDVERNRRSLAAQWKSIGELPALGCGNMLRNRMTAGGATENIPL